MDIFSWEDWQDFDDMFEMYINCKILRPIGGFDGGTEFPVVYFDKRQLVLSFYEDENGSKLSMEKRFVLED